MTRPPRILLTNDDGIASAGLTTLAAECESLGEVTVVAPEREMSGTSHALALDFRLRCRQLGPRVFALDSTPAACVKYGLMALFPAGERPDLLISGINRGANLGDDVAYSGTVGAAREGALAGVPSIAVSLVGGRQSEGFHEGMPFVVELARMVLARGLPRRVFLNVNVPRGIRGEIAGWRWTTQGRRIYYDAVVEETEASGERWVRIVVTREAGGHEEEGTDLHAVARRYISITPLSADGTAHAEWAHFEGWPLNGHRT